jgi:hypothetical protein
MTYIEEYYKWIEKNPNKVCKKVKRIYEKLVKDISCEKEVSFFNKSIGETETHVYVFDEKKSLRCIKFIEKYCKQSKGKNQNVHNNGNLYSCFHLNTSSVIYTKNIKSAIRMYFIFFFNSYFNFLLYIILLQANNLQI